MLMMIIMMWRKMQGYVALMVLMGILAFGLLGNEQVLSPPHFPDPVLLESTSWQELLTFSCNYSLKAHWLESVAAKALGTEGAEPGFLVLLGWLGGMIYLLFSWLIMRKFFNPLVFFGGFLVLACNAGLLLLFPSLTAGLGLGALMMSLYFYLEYDSQRTPKWYWLSVISAVLAVIGHISILPVLAVLPLIQFVNTTVHWRRFRPFSENYLKYTFDENVASLIALAVTGLILRGHIQSLAELPEPGSLHVMELFREIFEGMDMLLVPPGEEFDSHWNYVTAILEIGPSLTFLYFGMAWLRRGRTGLGPGMEVRLSLVFVLLSLVAILAFGAFLAIPFPHAEGTFFFYPMVMMLIMAGLSSWAHNGRFQIIPMLLSIGLGIYITWLSWQAAPIH